MARHYTGTHCTGTRGLQKVARKFLPAQYKSRTYGKVSCIIILTLRVSRYKVTMPYISNCSSEFTTRTEHFFLCPYGLVIICQARPGGGPALIMHSSSASYSTLFPPLLMAPRLTHAAEQSPAKRIYPAPLPLASHTDSLEGNHQQAFQNTRRPLLPRSPRPLEPTVYAAP